MPDEIFYLTKFLSITFGLIVGSFLNVVIYRVPRDLSIVSPGSSCPSCGHKIRWYENIPVLSYLFLKGKCTNCKTLISVRYPLIELLTGIIAGLLAPKMLTAGEILFFLFYFSIACIFLCHFLIDIEFQILPDKINLYFLSIALPFAFLNFAPGYWIVGGIIGFGGPFVVTYLFYKLRGQIGLGGGDIKLFGILGLLLGPLGILNTIFLSCLLGAVVGVTLILINKINKETPLAFGPYIIVVAILQIFFPGLMEKLYFIQ